jgi:hypothetical protein
MSKPLVIKLIFLIIIFSIGIFLFKDTIPLNYSIEKYGFFSGIFHGSISLFTIIPKIFISGVGIFAKNHTIGYTISFWISALTLNLYVYPKMFRSFLILLSLPM